MRRKAQHSAHENTYAHAQLWKSAGQRRLLALSLARSVRTRKTASSGLSLRTQPTLSSFLRRPLSSTSLSPRRVTSTSSVPSTEGFEKVLCATHITLRGEGVLVAAIETAVSETDIFASSTCNFKLEHIFVILVLVFSLPIVTHLRPAGVYAGSPSDSR